MNRLVSFLTSIPARLERATDALFDVLDCLREAIPEKLVLALMVIVVIFIAFLLSLAF